jgi:DNA-binding MarR family transcriptional regulator
MLFTYYYINLAQRGDTMSPNSQDTTAEAERFIVAAKALRQAIGADIPIQQVMILAYLWRNGRANQIELALALDLKVAAASRNCRSLSSYYVQVGDIAEERGQNLILAERNQTKSREMVYRLTEPTNEIMTSFLSSLGGINI